MLVFSYTHNSCPCAKPQNQPVCTDTPPKQLSHPLRRSNCSNPRRFETLGQHLEPHTRACATKAFVFCHSLPSAPGLANSKALKPSPTCVAKQPTGLGREQTQQYEKYLQLHISTVRWKTQWVEPVCSLAGPRPTSYNNSLHFRSGSGHTKVFLLQREASWEIFPQAQKP